MTWVTSEPTPNPDENPDNLSGPSQPAAPAPEAPAPAPNLPPADETLEERERRLAGLVVQDELETLAELEAAPIVRAAEPPIDPLADTSPGQAVRLEDARALPLWRRAVGLGMVLLAAALTFVAGLILLLPLLRATPQPTEAALQPTATTQAAATGQPGGAGSLPDAQPTLSPGEIAALLATPPVDLNPDGVAIARSDSPFTIIPERSRAEVIAYTIQDGDTISAIAERFGLEMDTIAWSNDSQTVFSLRPGNELDILPVNGVYHRVLVEETIQSIADKYGVDPYAIIGSEFFDLFGSTPERVLPSGTRVGGPGGTSTATDWTYNPGVERSSAASGASGADGTIAFAPGQPGSCGAQPNPGGTGYFANPLGTYNWVRGFSSYHTGVDLDAPVGTPVFASSAGRVIYRGWNNWGYGYMVVLAHGSFTTIYGHLNGINVSCGQMVGAGSLIATTGNSGNSSGPHLHFELSINGAKVNPLDYIGY